MAKTFDWSKWSDRTEVVRKEFDIAFRLQHKNIAACFGAMQSTLWPVVFFEWVDGQTLKQLWSDTLEQTKKTLTEDTLRPIASQLLEALHYLQTAQIFHG